MAKENGKYLGCWEIMSRFLFRKNKNLLRFNKT